MIKSHDGKAHDSGEFTECSKNVFAWQKEERCSSFCLREEMISTLVPLPFFFFNALCRQQLIALYDVSGINVLYVHPHFLLRYNFHFPWNVETQCVRLKYWRGWEGLGFWFFVFFFQFVFFFFFRQGYQFGYVQLKMGENFFRAWENHGSVLYNSQSVHKLY